MSAENFLDGWPAKQAARTDLVFGEDLANQRLKILSEPTTDRRTKATFFAGDDLGGQPGSNGFLEQVFQVTSANLERSGHAACQFDQFEIDQGSAAFDRG